MRRRKTDYGTIILHWMLVSATVVAFVTGLRIATEAPDRTWINTLDFLLPSANVWVPHIEAAVVLVVVAVAYAIYVTRSGLSRGCSSTRSGCAGCSAGRPQDWGRSACF